MPDDGSGVEIDLDRLAAGYDFRPPSVDSLRRADVAARRAGLGPGRLALDVGGGRGHHARRFASTAAGCIVIDRSPAMARAARQIPGVDAIVADARRLPVRDDSADLVWFHVSLHYGGWEAMLAEAVRVAKPGGLIQVWTFRKEHAHASFLAKWFPTVGDIDSARFPDPGDLAAFLRDAGCCDVASVASDEQVSRRAGDWEAGVIGGFVSTLQHVPEDELMAGLDRFRGAHPDPGSLVTYLLRYGGISGRTPSLR